MKNKFARQAATLLCLLLCVSVAFPMSCLANVDVAEETAVQPQAVTESAVPLTPDGQGTVIDNVTEENGKEFFTIMTPDENIFYLIIDRQRDSENVYFLNAVTESDLMALAEKDKESTDTETESAIPEPEPVCTCDEKCAPGEVDTDCPVCILDLKQCTGKEKPAEEAETEPGEETTKQSKHGANAWILILFAAAAGLAGGRGAFGGNTRLWRIARKICAGVTWAFSFGGKCGMIRAQARFAPGLYGGWL